MVECYYALCAYPGRYRDETSSGVRMRHRIIEHTCTYYHIASTERHGKAVQAPGGRPVEIFSIDIIMRTVTGTLEAHTVIAERNSTAKVDTTLIQGNPIGAISTLHEAL